MSTETFFHRHESQEDFIARLRTNGQQLTLGQLIAALSQCSPKKLVRCHTDLRLAPTTLASARGDYSQLALGYETVFRGDQTVEALLDHLQGSVGLVFDGYKGGKYTAQEDTPVWLDNWGEYSSIMIVAVAEREYDVLLVWRKAD